MRRCPRVLLALEGTLRLGLVLTGCVWEIRIYSGLTAVCPLPLGIEPLPASLRYVHVWRSSCSIAASLCRKHATYQLSRIGIYICVRMCVSVGQQRMEVDAIYAIHNLLEYGSLCNGQVSGRSPSAKLAGHVKRRDLLEVERVKGKENCNTK